MDNWLQWIIIVLLLIIVSVSIDRTHVIGQSYIGLQQSYSELQEESSQVNSRLSQANDELAQEKARIVVCNDLRNFSSLDELEWFLTEDKTDEHEYIRDVFDCSDFALMLQKNALEQGYLMNCQMLFTEHMMNMAIAGDAVYYIEPTTDEILFVNYH
jgi:hypothetical protein